MPAPEILAIIPARGGSKGVHRKNLRTVAGRSLVERAAACACEAACTTRVVVSTDDAEIAEVGRQAGGEIPFLRPAELASDTATDLQVLHHAVVALRESEAYRARAVLFLRPTCPLRTPALLDAVAAAFLQGDYDSVRSVASAPYPPWWMKTIRDGRLEPFLDSPYVMARRQDCPPVYYGDGAADIIDARLLEAGESLYGDRIGAVVSEHQAHIDIDTEEGLAFADLYFKRHGL